MKNLIDTLANVDSVKLKRLEKSAGGWFFSLFRIIILLSIGFIIIYPLFYVIVVSIQSKYAFLNSTRVWIPTDFDIIKNYTVASDCLEYTRAFTSTFKNEIVAALIQVATCAVAAYGLARFKFPGKRIITAILFMTILVPEMVLLIPKTVNFSQLDFLGILGLFNKLTGLDLRPNVLNTSGPFWLPAFFGVGLRSGILIYIYIQFFRGLPHELEEAAWVDGAGPIRTFLSIAIPSSGVVILTVAVFSLIWHWNDVLLSGMYLTKEYPLSIMLQNIETALAQKYHLSVGSQHPEAMAYMMASCLLYIAPMLIFYMIVQRWFIESIDRVGITG